MQKSQKDTIQLEEWKTANKRIDSIDARIWQGTGILLVISIGGFSLLSWSPPSTLLEYCSTVAVASISVVVLFIWQRIYQRWQYVQSIYGYRLREIESDLGFLPRLNLYARVLEYWDRKEDTRQIIEKLEKEENESYLRLRDFYKQQIKHKNLGRTPLYKTLNYLTYLLIALWILVIILNSLIYFF